MSIECSECERDARGGHDQSCSRYQPSELRDGGVYRLPNGIRVTASALYNGICLLGYTLHTEAEALDETASYEGLVDGRITYKNAATGWTSDDLIDTETGDHP